MTPRALLVFFICSCLIGLALAANPDRGPATLTIDINKKKKKVADFPHHKHQELDPLKGQCNKCHHAAQPGRQPAACGTCHKHNRKKDPDTGAPGFKKTFHKLCGACHLKDKSTPQKCKVCHKKK
jgi:hypothetical protein